MVKAKIRQHKRRVKGKVTEVSQHERRLHDPKKPFKVMPKGTYHLPVEQAILVPSTKAGDKKITPKELSERTSETQKFLGKAYGGYTSVKATGGYVMKNGKLVKEKVNKVTSFSQKKDFVKNRGEVKKFVNEKKKKWGQESIGVEQEGDLYYI